MVKLNTIAFKVTEEQEMRIRRMAVARKTTVSELVRGAVLGLESKPDADFWKRLHAFRRKMAARKDKFTDGDIKDLISRGRKF